MAGLISAFHFLRPLWLLALLPLAAALGLMWRRRLVSRSWRSVVDPRLLAHLLIGENARQGPWTLFAAGLGGLLAILALAGPAWQKLEQPVFRRQSALVVLLDLSRSMDAADVKPSRLLRAQLKLRDILKQQKEGETALIVYAATPFTVSPLTSDAKTIDSQIDSLSTDLMPAQGSRPDRAIGLAEKLLKQAGAGHGGVLMISDGIGGTPPDALKDAVGRLVAAGHRLSVLGVGTPEGAPIPDPHGGFFKDGSGAIVLPKLDDAGLEALARQGRGAYRRLSADDSDFHALLAPFDSVFAQQQSKKIDGLMSDQWRDEGPWLLLPLLLLGALAFRRGYLLVLLLLILPQAHPAYAFDWDSLWLRADQRGQQAMAARQPQQAAKLFQDPEWRAAADYRAGNYPAALESLKGIDNAEADYNRGNALAQMGRLPEAIAAYQEALKRNPKLADARYNRDLLEKMQKKPPPQASQSSGKQPPSPGQQGQSAGQPSKNGQQGPSAGQTPKNGQPGQSAGQPQPSPQASQNRGQSGKPAADSQQNSGGKTASAAAKPAEPRGDHPGADAKQAPGRQQPASPLDGKEPPGKGAQTAAEAQEQPKEKRQADEQWLRRIPDDPGGLWRRKFLYQYKQQQQGSEKQAW